MSRFDLIIFDCDGVLVDSEPLVVQAGASILSALGWQLSEAEIVERFIGRSAMHMHLAAERYLGRPVDWASQFEDHLREVFARELSAVDGVEDALTRITIPTCVASGGTHEMLRFQLGLTGLLDRFDGRIFSAQDVASGKPAPDVFLYAARQMGVGPGKTAVIEDSDPGVTAGLAAGMTVFAYVGAAADPSKLRRPGVVLFERMDELPELLNQVWA